MYSLRLIQVSKSFGPNKVLEGVNLSVEEGEKILVIGGSGSGKSVMLKLLCGLMRPEKGRVFLWDAEVSAMSEKEQSPVRRRVGMLFQNGALFDSMSVFENVAFPLRERGVKSEGEIREKVEGKLREVGLPGIGDRMPSHLSGGMRKRVAFARAIVMDPEIILYDEPTSGLDPANAKRLSYLVRDVHQRLGCTSCIVTHDMSCARIVGGRFAFLANRKILAEGPLERIEETGGRELRAFLDYGGSVV